MIAIAVLHSAFPGAASTWLPEGWAVSLVAAAVAFAVPLLLAAVGECIVERAGIINIGVEGMMLTAALAAVAVSGAAGSSLAGVGAGAGSALALGVLFGVFVVLRRANQVVTGMAINLLALGLTGAIYFSLTRRAALAGSGQISGVKLPDWPVPGLSALPLLGDPLFSANALVYLAFLAVPVGAFFLQRTRPGLRLRAVGEKPEAAEAAGVRVQTWRFAAVLVGALCAGLGGTFLAIGHVVTFGENMIAGKGFIALALVIFGRWSPWGILLGAALFSLASGFGTVLGSQGRGRPEEVFLLALPYVATLVVLIAQPGRSRAPAALGRPYPG
jgi:general nucleoside transport system permease protein